MDCSETENMLFDLMDKIDERILKYETNCSTKKKLIKFYNVLEELKMHVQWENIDECKKIIENSKITLAQGLRKANWEDKNDYNLFKKSVEENWQCLLTNIL